MAHLDLEAVSKAYGAHLAVDQVSLSIAQGEFVCFLGPSGCGKTTLLRLIAGLETPEKGAVRLNGRLYRLIFAARSLSPAVDQRFRASLESFHLINARDSALAAPRRLLDEDASPHDDRAAPGALVLLDAAPPVDEAGRGEVGPRDEPHQVVDGGVRVLDEVNRRVEDLAQVVGRDVGGHADRDAARAVHEEVRYARREDERLLLRVVEVRAEVDALLLDVGQELGGDPTEARFGVTVGGGGVTVD